MGKSKKKKTKKDTNKDNNMEICHPCDDNENSNGNDTLEEETKDALEKMEVSKAENKILKKQLKAKKNKYAALERESLVLEKK